MVIFCLTANVFAPLGNSRLQTFLQPQLTTRENNSSPNPNTTVLFSLFPAFNMEQPTCGNLKKIVEALLVSSFRFLRLWCRT